MKKLKRATCYFGIIAIILMCLAFMATAESEVQDNNITYKIYPELQTMVLSGKGKIEDHMFSFGQCSICYPADEDGIYPEPILSDEEEFLLSECNKIKTLVIEEGITEIGHSAFYAYSSLKNVETIILPETLEKIGAYAFARCNRLTKVYLPSNLKEIGEGAFAATNLRTISLPESVIEIGENAFYKCNNLKSVIFTNAVCSIQKCDSLEKIVYPVDFKKIPDIKYCKNLTDIVLPTTKACQKVKIAGDTGYEKYFVGCPKLGEVLINAEVCQELDKDKADYIYISDKLPSKLNKVKNLKCTDKGNITISWSAVENAGYYQVYYYKDGKWVKVYTGVKTTFTLNDQINYGTNKFKVRACAYDGSEYVRGSFASVTTYRLGNIYYLDAKASKNKVVLSWKWNGVEEPTGYQVYYRVKGGTYKKLSNSKTTKFTANKLKSGETYQFKIRAYVKANDKTFYGSFSSAKSVKIK